MIPTNPVCPVFNYAGSAQYCDLPSAEQLRAGVVPLDSLPAAWWNKMWADVTSSLNQAQEAAGCLISEINNVLAGAGICPTASCLDQLYQSINKIRQTLASTTVPGSVVSSADANKVAVAADGTMTVNCFGNAASLTTTAHTVVGAINELKSTYDDSISALSSGVAGKAPTMHASTGIDYGIGNASCYGHVKLSDTFDTDLGCAGVAASQTGLANAYQCLYSMIGDAASLGNTVACPAGTASAGTCNTAARSDHVHPIQTKIPVKSVYGYTIACACADHSVLNDLSGYTLITGMCTNCPALPPYYCVGCWDNQEILTLTANLTDSYYSNCGNCALFVSARAANTFAQVIDGVLRQLIACPTLYMRIRSYDWYWQSRSVCLCNNSSLPMYIDCAVGRIFAGGSTQTCCITNYCYQNIVLQPGESRCFLIGTACAKRCCFDIESNMCGLHGQLCIFGCYLNRYVTPASDVGVAL